MIEIRPEAAADFAAVAALNRAAFGGEEEAQLVYRLRRAGLVIAALVAAEDREVVGHILLSDLRVETDTGAVIRAAALAPMAVAPDRQRRGIGSRLVDAGLQACRDAGIELVVVLGHPGYYPRFGFSAARARHLRAPFSGPAFMALELAPGVLDGVRATVRYPDAFGLEGG